MGALDHRPAKGRRGKLLVERRTRRT